MKRNKAISKTERFIIQINKMLILKTSTNTWIESSEIQLERILVINDGQTTAILDSINSANSLNGIPIACSITRISQSAPVRV